MQVLVTAVVVGLVVHFVCGQPGPAAIVVGNGLALSSTAVVLQVMIIFCSHSTFLFPPTKTPPILMKKGNRYYNKILIINISLLNQTFTNMLCP
jgi:uncharacterized membrane protein YedE/YeeE